MLKNLLSRSFFCLIALAMVFSCHKASFIEIEESSFITIMGDCFFSFSKDGGSELLSFSANRDWSISSSESWCKVSPAKGAASSDNVTVSITVDENSSYDHRTCSVAIVVGELTKTVTVNQGMGLGMIVSPLSINLTNAAQTIEVDVKNNVQYSILVDDTSVDWIKQINTKGLDLEKVKFYIEANDGYDAREGHITFRQDDGDLAQTITVLQDSKDGVFMEKDLFFLSSDCQEVTINIEANVECTFEIPTYCSDWINEVKLTKSWSGKQIIVNVAENLGDSTREGEIYVKSSEIGISTIKVIQFPLGVVVPNESANSYIIPMAGYYVIPCVKGNSNEKIRNAYQAKVLWESFGTYETPNIGDLISNVELYSEWLIIKTTNPIRNGNAVVALTDEKGKILWSWHLWICEGYDPVESAQRLIQSSTIMMDRNIGALSSTPGDPLTIGLIYEWGRKDPFLCSASFNSSSYAASTLNWPKAVRTDAKVGTISYTIENPTTYVLGEKATGYNWQHAGHWSIAEEDNMLWGQVKTKYDPCPPGWKVPSGGNMGVWKGFDNMITKTAESYGLLVDNTTYSAPAAWYPCGGFRFPETGEYANVGLHGRYWSCSADSQYRNSYYGFFLYVSSDVEPHTGYFFQAANGFNVRCCRS